MERLNVLDAEFLHLEDDRWQFAIGGLCIFEGPPPSQQEVARFVAAKLVAIPRYRKRVRFLPFELGRPVWVDDPAFDIDRHVRRVRLPAPADDDALCALTGRLMSTPLDRDRPLWELWIVEGLADGRWALVTKVHHAMVDGIAAVDLHGVLLDHRPDAPSADAEPFIPEPSPSRVAMVLDAWRGLADDARAVVAGALAGARHPAAGTRALVGLAIGLGTFTLKLAGVHAPSRIQGIIGAGRAYAHASVPLADVQTIRKALGGSVNDVVLAVASGGYRVLFQHLGEAPEGVRLRSLVPVSVRAPDEHGVLHNKVSAILCDLPLHIADPVERLHAVSAQMARLKASHMAEAGAWLVGMGDLAPPFVVGSVTRTIARIMHRLPNPSVATVTTNVPGPREPLFFMGRRMLDWFPYVPLALGVRVGTAILSYAGKLAFGVTTDREHVPDAAVLARAIADAVAELLARARQRAGEAPSFSSRSIDATTLGSASPQAR